MGFKPLSLSAKQCYLRTRARPRSDFLLSLAFIVVPKTRFSRTTSCRYDSNISSYRREPLTFYTQNNTSELDVMEYAA